jgi:hypothetical protein
VQPSSSSSSLRAFQKYPKCNKRDVKSLEDLRKEDLNATTNKPNKQTTDLPSIESNEVPPKQMNSQFTLISGNIPLTKMKIALPSFPSFFSHVICISVNSIGTFMSFLYVLLPLLLDLVLLFTIYLIFSTSME